MRSHKDNLSGGGFALQDCFSCKYFLFCYFLCVAYKFNLNICQPAIGCKSFEQSLTQPRNLFCSNLNQFYFASPSYWRKPFKQHCTLGKCRHGEWAWLPKWEVFLLEFLRRQNTLFLGLLASGFYCTSTSGLWPNQTNIKNPPMANQRRLRESVRLWPPRRIWPSEDRIGWGSCKLPNNPSARLSTPQDITKVHVYYVPQQLLMLTLPGLSNILTNLLWSWHSNAAEPPQSEKQELHIGKDESVNKSIANSFTNGK